MHFNILTCYLALVVISFVVCLVGNSIKRDFLSPEKYGRMVLVSLILVIIVQFTGCIYAPVKQESRTDNLIIAKLESLGAKNGAEGIFFLGIGGISQSPSYTYCEKLPDGGLMIKNLSSDNVVLYEEDRQDACISQKQDLWVVTAIDSWLHDFFFTGGSYIRNKGNYHPKEIHVPLGTVKRGFNVDVNNM